MNTSRGSAPQNALKQAALIIQRLEERLVPLEEEAKERTESIAIVGIGCRFPGGASSPESFWEMLEAGRDTIQPLEQRWSLVGAEAGEEVPRWAGLLTEPLDRFDAAFFGVSPREARTLDPQHRLLLEVAWEAMEDGGVVPRSLQGSRTGIFVGACSADYVHSVAQQPREERDAYGTTGNLLSIAAGRLSYTLGFHGPCLTVDTACSSSLVAIHLACRSLRTRESELAFAGGVNVILSPETMGGLARTQALSPDGRCRTFDAAANGFVRGEGCGLILLKRLSDAQRDGDRIWALIRGSAVNQDGRSTGLTAPNVLAQEALLREALASARVAPGTIGYVETHGTGTPLGDPIEVEALRGVVGPVRADGGRCVLGAVKTNLGHLEGAAGVAGLIKASLALRHERIPKNINFRTLNAHIEIEGSALRLATESIHWPRSDEPRFAGVSSFGISGTNAHVVLEEAPAAEAVASSPERGAELFVVSAKNDAALHECAMRLRDHLVAHPELGLGDVAFSLATTRSAMEHRLAVSATTREALLVALEGASQGQTPAGVVRGKTSVLGGKVAFLFTGQGAQVLGMGRELHAEWPVFREAFDRCVALFDAESERSLREVMWAEAGSAEAALLDQTSYTQSALFVLEYALCALWQSWGVEPELLAGHSIGEVTAACVAGVFSVEDAVRLVAARGRLMQALPVGGAMVSIAASEAEVAAALLSHAGVVSIAAVNGPSLVVIAGAEASVQAVASSFSARGIRTKALRVSHAFHSSLMDPMLEAFGQVAESVTYRRPSMALVSSVSGRLVTDEMGAAGYWVRQVRESVRFGDAVKALDEAGAGTFVEVGPKPTLLGLVPSCVPNANSMLLTSLRAERNEAACMLEALGGLWNVGRAVAWSGVFPRGRRVSLPTYPWQRERYWIEATGASAARIGEATGHPLLGVRVPVAGSGTVFETILGLKTHPWLGDHRVAGQVLVPGAALTELVWAATKHGAASDAPVTQLVLQAPLMIPERGARRVQVILSEAAGQGPTAAVYSQSSEGGSSAAWTLHATATVAPEALASGDRADLVGARARCTEVLDADAFYLRATEVGVSYGPAFQGLRSLWRGEGESLAEVALPPNLEAVGYGVHPALLDAAFQAAVGAGAAEGELLLPFAMGRFVVYQPAATAAWVHARIRSADGPSISADVTLADESGTVLAEVTELRLQRADREAIKRGNAETPPDAFYQLGWREEPVEAPVTRPTGSWVVVADAGSPAATALAAQLEHCTVTEASGLGDALSRATSIAGVICMWEAGADEAPSATAQRVAVEGLSVVRALQSQACPRVVWVTRSAVAVHEGDAVSVGTSSAWGLGRTVMQEHPELGCTLVDLGAEEEWIEGLVRELSASDGETQVAWRAGRRYVARLMRVEARAPEARAVLPREGSVLVTGGLGALGLHVARWLASQGVRHLVMTGRRGLATPGASEAVSELEGLGARVTVAEVDVAEREALGAVLGALPLEFPLRGVVHAAGVLDDGVLAEQTAERFARVLSPKVAGAWNLHELTAGAELDFFVMFSSVSGLLGAAGQSNYAAANTFLDALAAHRRASGLPAHSLAWGPWLEGGMAAGLGAAQQARLARQGMKALSSVEGIALFEQALSRSEAQLGVVRLDLQAIGRAFSATVPPVWRALVRAPVMRAATRAAGAWATRLAELPPSRRVEEVRAVVQSEVARVLSLKAASAVPVDRPLSELGLDSLMAVELRNALGQHVGKTLPATLAFDYPTVDALTRWLLDDVLVVTEPAAPLTKVSKAIALHEPIAIVGLGCRFPGGVTDPESFWRLLDDGVDGISEVPSARWDIDALYDPDPDAPGKMMTRWGGFVSDVDRFDPAFFGISPREATMMDPQQRLLLETSWEALEAAGMPPDRLMGSDTGVFVGLMYQEYASLGGGGLEALDGYVSTGNAASIASGRISYVLGLKGPSLTVDTACSSSLVTVHLACQALRQGECSLALAGGASLMLTPASFVEFSRLRGLAPDGRCKSFAASADGVAWSEGCGMVVLKRLSDAQRDGDPILAVIRGSAVNQDGRSQGMTAPNGPSQQAVIRRALEQAGVLPSEVDYVECHGTGTTLGDPIEVQALGAVLSTGRAPERPVVIGSSKSNVGHTQAAAGAAGIMKVVLSLQHDRIPKNLHFDAPSPHIPWSELPVKVAHEAVAWPRNGVPRRAGVSSFGISGTNAHVVLEEAPTAEPVASSPERGAELFVVSAKSDAALHECAMRLRDHLVAHPELGLGDVAFSLATTRSAMEHRLAVSATTREALLVALEGASQGQTPAGVVRNRALSSVPKVVFVFPGQGSQWLGMGRQLLEEEPVFRAELEACDRAIQAEAGWSLLSELRAEESSSQLHRIDVVQPSLFAMAVGLSALWRSWGVEPAAVVGHSMGEVAAAYVAEALSLEDAVAIMCRRSRLLLRIGGQGEMAVVELSLKEAEAALAGYEQRLSVAVSNSPRSTVLSGEPLALGEVLSLLEAKGVFCRRVKVDVASHSPQVDPLREDLVAALSGVKPQRVTIPMRSTVTRTMVTGLELEAGYWADNLRQPVHFSEAVHALMDEGHGLFIEMSPHPILSTSVEEIRQAGEREGVGLGSLRRGQAERFTLLESLGALWTRGYPMAWDRLHLKGGARVPLPTYPWQRERYWIEMPSDGGVRGSLRVHGGSHPLLGEAQTLSTQAGTRLWETTLDVRRLPWLSDHRVQGAVVLPGAAYVEVGLACGAEVFGETPFAVTDVVLVEALAFAGDAAVAVQVVATEEQAGLVRFQVASRNTAAAGRANWRVHARGMLRRTERGNESVTLDVAGLRARLSAPSMAEKTYAELNEIGLEYGPAFQGLMELQGGEGEALGQVHLPEAAGSASAYAVHPAVLDACFQAMAGALTGSGGTTPWVPVEIGSVQVFRRPSGELWCHAQIAREGEPGPGRQQVDLRIVDKTGASVVEIRKLVVQRLASGEGRREEDDWFLELSWESMAVPKSTAMGLGRWLVLGAGGGLGTRVRSSLEARGHAVVHVTDGLNDVDMKVLVEKAFGGQAPTAVVHLGSLEEDGGVGVESVEGALERGCDSVLATVQALCSKGYRDAPRLWLVTRGAQAVGGNEIAVAQSPLLGLGRVIAMEHAELRCGRLDLDPSRPDSEVEAVLAELLADDTEEEIALRGGERRVARLARPRIEKRRERVEMARGRSFRLEMDAPGVLDHLTLRGMERREPRAGEVEIEVEAAGLNFLDVLLALGVMPNDVAGKDKALLFGGECAGRIVAVGEGVKGLAVGQGVIALAGGTFASHVTTSSELVLPRPSALSATEAAALPVAYLTAWYALDRVARLERGERVLIHAATGGVGLAAVQWAQHVGAEVYATAGSPEKRAYLESLGVKYVSDSRTDRFVSDVRTWTGGEGVDVVLNSLSGELIEKSFMLLRSHGRFVELGKRDYYANNQLGLQPFLRNLSFSLVDLRGMIVERAERVRRLFEELLALVDAGVFTPPPIARMPMGQAADAFRKMAQAQHLGKLVLTLADPEVPIHIPAESHEAIRADGSYLVTGGLGGLGLSVAGWLAKKGAGHLVLVGRTGVINEQQRAAVAAMQAHGARVTVAKADVADRAQMAGVIDDIAASGIPLSGVVHAAGVLDDGLLMQQTPERFRTVMGPKILGALHLHALTLDAPLSFFVMYSSGAGLLGSPGQGNYAAANTFLDALAHHRRTTGLPGLSIDWGAFSDVGLAVAQSNRGARLDSRGMRSLTPAEGLTVLERLLDSDHAQVGVMPINLRQWAGFYQTAAASPLFSRLMAEQRAGAARSTGDKDLLARLAAADPDERMALLQTMLRTQVSQVLRIPENKFEMDAPFTSLGMDSLMGLELRNRIEAALGINMPAALAWTYPTINAMTRWLHDNASFADASVGKKGLLKATLGAAALTYAVRFRPLTQPRVRFFCFHGAGGSPEAFAKWPNLVPADVEVLGIWHLRHRDGETAPALKYLEDTVSLIQRDADVPYVLIGLSLGGAFAWRVAKELVRRRERSNLRGICAVATPLNSRTRGRSDEQEMMRTLHEQRAPGYEKALEQIRADVYKDLDLVDAIGWPAESNEALPIPIIAFAGLSDEEAPPAAIQRWRSLTTAAFHLYVSPGDHLAVVNVNAEDNLQRILSHLDELLSDH